MSFRCHNLKIHLTNRKEADKVSGMIKTKLTIELDVETQFGPEDAVNLVDVLTRIPAITGVNVIALETNYVSKVDKGFPEDVQSLAIKDIPKKIR